MWVCRQRQTSKCLSSFLSLRKKAVWICVNSVGHQTNPALHLCSYHFISSMFWAQFIFVRHISLMWFILKFMLWASDVVWVFYFRILSVVFILFSFSLSLIIKSDPRSKVFCKEVQVELGWCISQWTGCDVCILHLHLE